MNLYNKGVNYALQFSKSTFTWEVKWTHTGLRFQTGLETSSVHLKFNFGCILKWPNILMDMCRHFISGGVYMILKRHFCQNDRYEIHTVLSFISPQFMWTQVKTWLNNEVRFSTEMKSHIGLSSIRLSCERTLIFHLRGSEFDSNLKHSGKEYIYLT